MSGSWNDILSISKRVHELVLLEQAAMNKQRKPEIKEEAGKGEIMENNEAESCMRGGQPWLIWGTWFYIIFAALFTTCFIMFCGFAWFID